MALVNLEVPTAYRFLYRKFLKAVQYSKPARLVVRDQLRVAFREKGAKFDAEGVRRTGWFLDAAAVDRGMEHKILKNLIRVRLIRERKNESWGRVLHESKNSQRAIRNLVDDGTKHYDMTVAMLNHSLGTCLR